MDDFDPDAAAEGRELFCANLIACYTIWYDNTNTDAGYSLGRVMVHVRPPSGWTFPFRIPRHFLFVQLHGTPTEYIARVRFVRIAADDDGEEVQTELIEFGPWELFVPGDNYVECFGLSLVGVPYPEPGVYEYQLWVDGLDGPLGRERVQARE